MDLVRYFRNVLTKPNEKIEITNKVFSIPLNKYVEFRPDVLIKGYPEITPSTPKKKKQASTAVEQYKLDISIHAGLIQKIIDKLNEKDIDPNVRHNIAIFGLRSSCSLLFPQISEIPLQLISETIQCLKIILYFTELLPLIKSIFQELYNSVIGLPETTDIIPYIEAFRQIGMQYKDFTKDCIHAHAMIVLRFCDVIPKGEAINTRLISDQFLLAAYSFNSNQKPIKDEYTKLSKAIMNLVEYLKTHFISIHLNGAVLQIIISIRKHIEFDVSPFMEVLNKMCPMNTLFDTNFDASIFGGKNIVSNDISAPFEFLKYTKLDISYAHITEFKSLLDLELSKTHPLINFSKLSGVQFAGLNFDLVAQIIPLLLNTVNDSLNMYVIFMIILLMIKNHADNLGPLLVNLKAFDSFFPMILFDPEVTSFTSDNVLISIRKLLFSVLSFLAPNPKAKPVIRAAFVKFLKKIAPYGALFSDTMCMAVNSLDPIFELKEEDELLKIIINGLLLQQEYHRKGDKLAPKYRPPTFIAFKHFLSIKQFIEAVNASPYTLTSIFHFLYEEDTMLFALNTMASILNLLADDKTNQTKNMSRALHSLLSSLISKIKNPKAFDLILSLLGSFSQILEDNIEKMPKVITSTGIISDVVSVLVNLPPYDKAPLALRVGLDLLILIQQCQTFVFEGMPFTSLGMVAASIGIDQLIYDKICTIVFGHKKDRIAVPEALPLLIIASVNTKFYPEVLKKILTLCESSAGNRAACIAGGLPGLLFDNYKDEDFEIIVKIIVSISKSGCTHRGLVAFFRQFSSVEPDKKFNKRILGCVHSLLTIIESAKPAQHYSMLLCSSEFSGIILPTFTAKELTDQWIVYADIFLDSKTPHRNIFKFKSSNFEIRADIINGEVNLSITNEDLIIFKTKAPSEEWFTIAIILNKNEHASLIINNLPIETIDIKPLPLNIDFTDNTMFKIPPNEEYSTVMVRKTQVYTKYTNWDIEILPNVVISPNMIYGSNLTSYEQFQQYGSLLFSFDHEAVHPDNRKTFSYSGSPIRFFSNFMKVFEASGSVNFLISLFAQIGFVDENGDMAPCLLIDLLKMITMLIEKSEKVVTHMIKYHMYSVISNFLIEADRSLLTHEVWDIFVDQHNKIQVPELKAMQNKTIMFNFTLWQRASLDIQVRVFNFWKECCEKDVNMKQYLRFSILLSIYNSFTTKEDIDDGKLREIREPLKSLMLSSLRDAACQEDADFLLASIRCCPSDEQVYDLMTLAEVVAAKPWFVSQRLHFASGWASLFEHKSNRVRAEMINVISIVEKSLEPAAHLLCMHIISTHSPYKQPEEKDSCETSTIVNCCRKAVGMTEKTSLKEILERDSIVLTSPIFFRYALAAAISAPNELSHMFLEFVNKALTNEANIKEISTNFNQYGYFLMIYWGITKEPMAYEPLAVLSMKSSSVFSTIVNIIDVIAMTTNFELDKFRNNLLTKVLRNLKEMQISDNSPRYSDIIALSIMFRTRPYSSHILDNLLHETYPDAFYDESSEGYMDEITIKSVETEVIEQQGVPHVAGFFLRRSHDGEWLDSELAIEVMRYLETLLKEYHYSVWQPFIMLSTFFLTPTAKPEEYKEVVHIILEVLPSIDQNDEFIGALARCVCRMPPNEELNPLVEALTNILGDMSDPNKFVLGFHAVNNYAEQPPASLDLTFDQLCTVFSEFFKKPLWSTQSEVEKQLAETTEKTLKIFDDLHEASLRHWHTLWATIAHERSPFFMHDTNLQMRYKRFAMNDTKFRPILLKRNSNFNNHLDASLKRDAVPPAERERRLSQVSIESLPFFAIKPVKYPEQQPAIIPESNKRVMKVPCEYIQLGKVVPGTFIVTTTCFRFYRENMNTAPMEIPLEKIMRIVNQYILQRQTAIEIFTTDNRSLLFNFPEDENHKIMATLRNALRSHQMFASNPQSEALSFQTKWMNYEISTFQYLMWLNELSGRSMNNIEAYPVFPWLISDNTSETLDLKDSTVFRDLSKPIGALGKTRLEKLKLLKENSMEPHPFLYSNMYSCAFNVLHYLIRMEPFTTIHIGHQDGKFDVPSRLFTSIPESFRNVIDSNNNFRELIPEFFFCPEFLRNENEFDLGKDAGNDEISDVTLPSWAKTPEEFIYIHKRALESDYVSQSINQWIDLIWGYKQTGSAAETADNTFDPRLYSDVWEKYKDKDDQSMIEAMLHNIGSIPIKLFDKPHPQRSVRPPKLDQNFQKIQVENSIIGIRAIGEPADKISTYVLLSDGRVFICRPNKSLNVVSREEIKGIAVVAEGGSGRDTSNFAIVRAGSSELIIVRNNGSIARCNSTQHIESISCACIFSNRIITGGADSLLVEWHTSKGGEIIDSNSGMSHADMISCCAASNAYGIVVSCSIDGMMIVSLLSDFSFIRSVYLKLPASMEPVSLRITDGMGLIVVNAAHSAAAVDGCIMTTYSINGRQVARINLTHRINVWCTATDSSDLDYLLVAEGNDVVMYDAFTLKKVASVFEGTSQVASISYHRKADIVFIGDESGALNSGPLFRALFL